MPIENPYQSPEADSGHQSVLPAIDLVTSQRPTWRFWVLVVICILPLFFPLGFALEAYLHGPKPGNRDSASGVFFSLGLLAVLAFSGLLIFTCWRAPALQRTGERGGENTGLVMAAIWLLALLAVPSAFFSISLSAMLLGAADQGMDEAISFGFLVGLAGPVLVGWLARGLWLDAIGRPRNPTVKDNP